MLNKIIKAIKNFFTLPEPDERLKYPLDTEENKQEYKPMLHYKVEFLALTWYARGIATVPLNISIQDDVIVKVEATDNVSKVTKLSSNWYNVKTKQNDHVGEVECVVQLDLDVLNLIDNSPNKKYFPDARMSLEKF